MISKRCCLFATDCRQFKAFSISSTVFHNCPRSQNGRDNEHQRRAVYAWLRPAARTDIVSLTGRMKTARSQLAMGSIDKNVLHFAYIGLKARNGIRKCRQRKWSTCAAVFISQKGRFLLRLRTRGSFATGDGINR